jgi:hypothetical protein
MESIESVFNKIFLNEEKFGILLPGEPDSFEIEKDRSCEVLLSSSKGIITKLKERCLEKTVYEYLSLKFWKGILEEYSKNNKLEIKSPNPRGILDLRKDDSKISFPLVMDFIQGYEIKSLSNFRKNVQVKLFDKIRLPIIYACALHLGYLNRLKEEEKLLHADYDGRHILFKFQNKPFLGVIDVENSTISSKEEVEKESKKILNLFSKYVQSPRDKEGYMNYYEKGYEMFKPLDHKNHAEVILEEIYRKDHIDFDIKNKKINGKLIP